MLTLFLPEAKHNEEKTPSEKILTDGCGFINGAALTLIARHLGLAGRPTAVQGRVAGSKGLWILHPEHKSAMEPPRIWIRDSQRKVRLPPLGQDSAHVIFDLVAQSNNITFPSRLNKQLTINLAENGVSTHAFEELLREGLSEIYTLLTEWDGAGAMPLLWSSVNNMGGVSRSRLQKVARGLARAIGLSRRSEMDREDAEDDEDDELEDPDMEADFKSLHQRVLELIQAGFNPKVFPFLHDEMRTVLKQAMKLFLNKYHIEVPQSAEAFIVPGVCRLFLYPKASTLSEFRRPSRSSRGRADPIQIVTRAERPINGDECVLHSWASARMSCRRCGRQCRRHPTSSQISRNPTMLASDIRKVINVPESEVAAEYTPRLRQSSTSYWQITPML